MTLRTLFDQTPAAKIAHRQIETDLQQARLSWKFRCYYRLRPLIPTGVRQLLQRHRPVATTDTWYLPDAALEELTQGLDGWESTLIHPWPEGADYSLVLSHDVETAEGTRNISRIADLEEELGFRSSWNIVPYKYKVDPGLIRDLQSRKFEIGIHGYNHDGRLYESRSTFSRRAVEINRALDRFDAVGFRSPMVHRDLEWLQMLNIEYDASCFDVDPYQAMPGGVGSLWPFQVGKFVELPYTLPQDHTLFIAQGLSNDDVWRRKFEFVVGHSGMLLMLTHPDYLTPPHLLEAYRRFLLFVRERSGHWHATPAETATWWQHRSASQIQTDTDGRRRIIGPAAKQGRIAELTTEGSAVRFRSANQSPQPARASNTPRAIPSVTRGPSA